MPAAAPIDVLMITYNRPDYTRLALERLLETCDDSMRVWIWHNGMDEPTLKVARDAAAHPRVVEFHHSEENQSLREPTNWLWRSAKGALLSKVDDDCLVPKTWADDLRKAHHDVPEFGVLGCWRFQGEDFDPEAAAAKIREFPGGHSLLVNFWVEGSGYLMKRECLAAKGLLAPKQSFTEYCIELSLAGWVNGWVYPFLYQEHMDDPRAEHTSLKTDADLNRFMPLSAIKNGVTTLAAWEAQLRRSALIAQTASIDPRYWSPLRRKVRNLKGRVHRLVTGQKGHW